MFDVLNFSCILLTKQPAQKSRQQLRSCLDIQVIAIGGLSFPAMGTDGKGMRLLESRGHTLCKPYPALTPMVGAHVASKQLAGKSALWRYRRIVHMRRQTYQVIGSEQSSCHLIDRFLLSLCLLSSN